MSEFWKDKDRIRGIIVSAIVHIALFLVFLFFGLSYLEPKPEDGIVINFGNSETGFGDQADGSPQISESTPPESTPETSESPEEATETPTLTQDIIDAPALEEKKEKKEKTEKPKEVEKPKKVEPTPEELEQKRLEAEKEAKRKEMEERFTKVSNSKSGGEGVEKGEGDQGDPNGDPNSQNRTGGNGGNGGGGNYMLGGRQALSKPRPEYKCDAEGRVVVKIYVDRDGKVTRAIPGEKVPSGSATTTTSSCLFEKAKAAAMRTTWQGDSEAPSEQVGYIIYNFSKN